MKASLSIATALLSLTALAASIAAPTAAIAKEKTEINQPLGEVVYTSVGDRMVRVTIQEPLPNAFGGSDIFGRKRERGFVELRFMGIAEDGRAIFQRSTVDVISNETTLSRSQSWSGGSTINQSGSGANAAVVIEAPDGAGLEVLPPNTIEFALDMSKHRTITVEDYAIHLDDADPGGVSFQIVKRRR